MKKFLAILLVMVSVQVFAQNNVISAINITLPANPDANTANWGTGKSLFMISATAQSATGRIDPAVEESKLLVLIKRGGNTVCGAYAGSTAPAADFNTMTKVWSGTNAVSFLGKDCTLAPGDYEVSVQFFGYSNGKYIPLSDEKTKPFTIKGNDQEAYQPPQAISPADGTAFSETDIKKPITFRWTPVIPKRQDPVTYRLSVWQLMVGQTGAQAMKANTPIITKDVDNITQVVITNIVDGPCRPPLMCAFIWNIQALDREGKPIGGNNGTSGALQFSAGSCDVQLTLKLQSVECLPGTNGNNNYKVCVSATYSSAVYNLNYANSGSGFKAYAPSYTPVYSVTGVTPALQVQNSGPAGAVNYCFNVSVPAGQTAMKIGLQGDDNNPGPISCQAGAELDLRLPACTTCKCGGSWNPLTITTPTRIVRYDCGINVNWKCNEQIKFTNTYLCSPDNAACQAKTSWVITQNGVSIKTGSGTNTISDDFTPTANGAYTVTLNASCNGVQCPQCTYTFNVTDCKACGCGTWSPLTVNRVEKFECNSGKAIPWICNKPFNFTSAYQCNPNDGSCLAKTAWEIKKDGVSIKTGTGTGNIADSFTPVANGTYTITLYAECNGKGCDNCTYTVVVTGCPPACDCGTWSPLTVNRVEKFECGGKNIIPWTCHKPFSFITAYQCSPNNESCQAKTEWVITQNGVSIKTGSGTNTVGDSFTPDANGIYTITLNAECNGIKCPPCSYTISVRDCKTTTCDCGTWSPLTVNRVEKFECGGKNIIPWKCHNAFNFITAYQCSPNNESCQAKTEWVITQNGVSIKTGSGTNNIGDSFTPDANGIYTITLNAECNGIKCPPCSYTISVKDCPTCNCGTWSPLTVNRIEKFECGGKNIIPWKCHNAFNFITAYQCSPNNESCQAKTEWVITQNGVTIKTGSGTNNIGDSFTPDANGIYTITLNAECNGI
ncbi:MAG: hypothetical protein ACHQIM_07475, partial [Sphingobacteriales bacterium]